MSRAVVFNEFGGIDVLHIVDVPDAAPGPGEVAVDVKAVGLNPFDVKLRTGVIPMPVEFPRCTCSDFSGTVTAVGTGARFADGKAVAVGDDVFGWIDSGAMRDQAVVSTASITKKPENLSFELAAGLATAGLTAQAVFDLMHPTAGDTVVVGAAAGAVGIIYCQLAVATGARVIGTASEGNHEFLRGLGVEPVTYGPGLAERLREAAPDGITIVQDNWGREFIDVALELGVPPQQICTIVDHAATAELGLSNPGRYERRISVLAGLGARFAAGDLVLPLERTFALSEFVDAFALLERRHVRGKIIVVP